MYLKLNVLLIFFACISNSQQNAITLGGRIVYGQDAAEGQFPFYARIKSTGAGNEILCGGSLIKTDWIYTAAQCVQGFDRFEIGLGSTQVGQLLTIIATNESAHFHPDFNRDTMGMDVALIQIPNVTLSGTIQTIDLPWWIYGYDDFFINLHTQIMGFGILANGTFPNRLQFADIVTIPTPSCRAIYGSAVIGTDKICGTGIDAKQNFCHGDYGGPLIFRNATTTFQIGIASFYALSTCESVYPSAYTRVESNLKFVEVITGWQFN